MLRIEKILQYVEQKAAAFGPDFPGVDTSDVSAALSIWRTDASSLLNRLCASGRLKKTGKKPVRYFPMSCSVPDDESPISETAKHEESTETAFASLAGYCGSLKAQIETAKAAVLYPPSGLHTLIIGETGVGKSLFAEEMWKFAKQNRKRPSDEATIPYVVFNCAEYADNPQLLLSQIFGYTKGAFTGAKEDKPGLVELADGGILFLDEIHRLPHTGQELFFTLLDKGQYRRLGDSRTRSASLIVIGATSEDPASALLSTFKRRMPVLIQIPSLSNRSLNERLALIRLFLSHEAERLDCPIFVSGNALRVLASYQPKANIGDLRNDIQLCCARSYLSHRLSGQSENAENVMLFDIPDLPQKVYLSASDRDLSSLPTMREEFTRGLLVHPDDPTMPNGERGSEDAINLYQFIETQQSTYYRQNLSQEEREHLSVLELERYWEEAAAMFKESSIDGGALSKDVVPPGVWKVTTEILGRASLSLERKYGKSVPTALALHLQQFVERVHAGQIIYNPYMRHITRKYPREMEFLNENTDVMIEHLGITPSMDELCFLAMYLGSSPVPGCANRRVGIVVAAHGDSMATSIADFANQALGTDVVKAVNAPLRSDAERVLREICQAVIAADSGRGVLLLVDSESFTFLQKKIVRETGISCQAVRNVNSFIALEATRIVLSGDMGLEESHRRLMAFSRKFYANLLDCHGRNEQEPGDRESLQKGRRPVVLILCSTGIGTALRIRDILLEEIPSASSADIFTASILDDIDSIVGNYSSRLCLIISGLDPGLEGVRFFPVERVLEKDGLAEIESCLLDWIPPSSAKRDTCPLRDESILELLAQNVDRFAPSLPKDALLEQVRRVAEQLETTVYSAALPSDAKVRLFMHTMTLFERLSQGDIVESSELQDLERKKNPSLYARVDEIMTEACRACGLDFPESELYYMVLSLPDRDDVVEHRSVS